MEDPAWVAEGDPRFSGRLSDYTTFLKDTYGHDLRAEHKQQIHKLSKNCE